MRRHVSLNRLCSILVIGLTFGFLTPAAGASSADSLVTIGSPAGHFPNNRQNEPSVAIDPAHPSVVAAGANDEIDEGPCPEPPTVGVACPFTNGVGISGVYFSFDEGSSWTQPTYTGWAARSGTPEVGPIGTLPKYYENGMASHGDPAVAFGPAPGQNGRFSWANGSRLYYGNITFPFGNAPFKYDAAITVSRTDDVEAAAAGDQGAWKAPVVVAQKGGSSSFNDKDDLTADNASSSPHFGNVYVCWSGFRSRGGLPEPMTVARSTDGGSTWNVPVTLTPARNSNGFEGRQGCQVGTDSEGNVYVVWEDTIKDGSTQHSVQVVSVSHDGGASFSRPRVIAQVADVGILDPLGNFTFDGVAGSRTDSYPILDIANGAPSGRDATDELVVTWPDASNGLNHEQALVTTSTNAGQTWSRPRNGAEAGDRPDNPAIAIAPDGSTAYLTYNAYLDPYRTGFSAPRRMQGVVRVASISANGSIGTWQTAHRGEIGDDRATTTSRFDGASVYDYNAAAASRTYGLALWNDIRRTELCRPFFDYYRSVIAGTPEAPPNVYTDCPARFGNTDIYAASVPAP
ncbi:MAG: sialidase family protein [Actinomycetota bacterium]